MTATVTVAADAPLGVRDVTVSGGGRCSFSFTGTGKFTVTAGAGAGIPTKLAITAISPASPTAGVAFSVTVQAQDAGGSPANVTSATLVTLSLNTGTGTLGGTVTGTIANGTSSVTIAGVTYSKAETGVRLTATATSGMGLTAGTSAAFNVVGGTFVKLQLLVPGETAAPNTVTGKTGTPTAQTAGVPFTVTVNAVDANWNLVSSTHTIRITSSDAAATLPADAALLNGTRTFSVTLNTAGTRTVTATDITDGTKTASTSPSITVLGTYHLSFTTQPGGGAAGAAWSQQPVVKILNASNQVVTSDNSTTVYLAISTNPAAGTLSCTGGTSLRVTNGVATFSGCSINLSSANYYTLAATSSPVWTPATSSAFYVTGSRPTLAISVSGAYGNNPPSGYTAKTPKIQHVGEYVTWRFAGGTALASQRVNVMVAKKVLGVWGSPQYYKSLWADASGVVKFPLKFNGAAAVNVRIQWPGSATYAVSASKAIGAYWE